MDRADEEQLNLDDRLARTELIIGDEAIKVLNESHIIILGIGGVGGYVAETLARTGVGAIDIVDNDYVSVTNLNRQLIALRSTIGRAKTEVMKERLEDAAPGIDVTEHRTFFLPETSEEFDFSEYDYVIDCVDTVKAKVAIIEKAKREGAPVISSMGAGNKIDPTLFRIADISETEMDPLAKVIRRKLRELGIEGVKVVYSDEKPKKSVITEGKRHAPGSIAFVPAAAGLTIASAVVNDLIESMRKSL